MEPADREQLERVVALVREVLGGDLRGAYLFGSAVLGGLRPESDLDVLAVSRRATSREVRRRIVERLLAISGRAGRRVELTVVVEGEIRPWRYPPRFDFQYGDWLRGDFEAGELDLWASKEMPDLAVLLTMVLLADRPLAGPPPCELVEPVPRADLVRALRDDLDRVLDGLGGDTRNVVLTLARIWSTLADGEIRSKDDAAGWALARLPGAHRPVLERARAAYLGEQPERWDDLAGRIRPHADHVAAEIRRAAAIS